MERRNDSNQNNSPFVNLSGSDYNKKTESGQIEIFTNALKRDNTGAKAYPVTKAPIPKIKKRKSRRKRQGTSRGVTLSVLMIYAIVGFFMASWLIMRYSSIIKTDEELDTLQNDIEILQAEVDAKELAVSLRDDIGMVQIEARERLNMDYPRNDQIVYILHEVETQQVSNGETIEVSAQ